MVLAVALYVAAPLTALALRDLTDDVLAHRAGPALAAAVLASAALVAQLILAISGCPGIRSTEATWLAMGIDGWISSR